MIMAATPIIPHCQTANWGVDVVENAVACGVGTGTTRSLWEEFGKGDWMSVGATGVKSAVGLSACCICHALA